MREWLTNMEVRTETRTKLNYDTQKDEEYKVENEFDAKLKAYSERKRVRSFEIGFTGWIVDAYNKYVKNLSVPTSNFQGEVNDKIKVEATVTSVSGFGSSYGWTNVYKMSDIIGNVYTKFGTINARYADTDEIKEGTVIKVTAVVKKHNEYKGKKEAVLGRVSKF